MAALTFPTLPIRIVRGVAERVRSVLARRVAAPVVVAVRDAGLTRLPHRALTDLHDAVLAAEASGREGLLLVVGAGKGGSAVVMADARSSAREVRLYGATSRDEVATALAAHGFPPATARVTLADGLPEGTEPVAVAHIATHDPEVLAAVLPGLLGRLAPGGVAVVDAAEVAACRAVVDAACEGRSLRRVQRTRLHLVRPR